MISRPLSLSIALALTLLRAVHADDIASYTVFIAAPSVRVTPSRRDLDQLCGRQAEGCTHIRGASFSADCGLRSGTWRIAPQVSFVPYLTVPAGERHHRIYVHEMTHIEDMRRSMENYARRIAGVHFQSLEECRAFATGERDRIEDLMRSFAEESHAVRR
jgi:hypothetical protein